MSKYRQSLAETQKDFTRIEIYSVESCTLKIWCGNVEMPVKQTCEGSSEYLLNESENMCV